MAAVQGGEVEHGAEAGEVPAGPGAAEREEAGREAAQVHQLHAARVKGQGAGVALRFGAALDEAGPDAGQGQFAGEHQAGGACSHDEHIGVRVRRTGVRVQRIRVQRRHLPSFSEQRSRERCSL